MTRVLSKVPISELLSNFPYLSNVNLTPNCGGQFYYWVFLNSYLEEKQIFWRGLSHAKNNWKITQEQTEKCSVRRETRPWPTTNKISHRNLKLVKDEQQQQTI